MADVSNLTTMEVNALTDVGGTLNLTDGHARLPLTAQQQAIVARLPNMFVEATLRPFRALENHAHETFLQAIGQHSAPIGTGRILSCHSSTLATDMVARALKPGSALAVLHPTFDNIADLFRTRGLLLEPFQEESLLAMHWPDSHVSAVVVTHPNNPTGLVIPEGHLRSLAKHCAWNSQTLIIDASFRGQVRSAQYDCYAILEHERTDWIVIEDTGKLWPTHELKIGLLAYSERTKLPIGKAFSESMLSASPVVLQLVAALAADWADGGYERARDLVEHNRALVRLAAESAGLRLADPLSEISVARVMLPESGPDSSTLYKELVGRGVHVLPCAPFHWAYPDQGRRTVRLSLARPSAMVEVAAKRMVQAYSELSVPTAT